VGAILDVLYHHSSLSQLGIRVDTIVPAIALYVPFVVVSMIVLLLLSRTLKTRYVALWKNDPFFLPAAVFLSAGQQFLYQGVLLQRLLSEYSFLTAILITAFLYAFLHILFPWPWFNFFLTFPAGVLFALIFTVEPNLFVASAAHFILNITAVQLSFVAFLDTNDAPERTF
jgi:membrane protease YdiL (CAAX protease family)